VQGGRLLFLGSLSWPMASNSASSAEGLIAVIDFMTAASIADGMPPVTSTTRDAEFANRLAERETAQGLPPPPAHLPTLVEERVAAAETPPPPPPAVAALPDSVGASKMKPVSSGIALSDTVTDTCTVASSEDGGDVAALPGEDAESDERFEWCGNHVYDEHSGELRWADRPDHLSFKRGDRVMETMRFNTRAELRDMTCTVTTYKKVFGTHIPVFTKKTLMGSYAAQGEDEPPHEFNCPPNDVPNSFAVCGEYKVTIVFRSASTGSKPLLVRHAWSKIS